MNMCVFLQLAPKEPIGEEFPHEESEVEEKESCLFDFPPTWVCSFFPGSAFLLTISSHLISAVNKMFPSLFSFCSECNQVHCKSL
jgi:hypothetical protein